MKRPILIALIGYIIGIIWELYFNKSIAPFVITLILIYIIHKGSRNERKNKTYKYKYNTNINYLHANFQYYNILFQQQIRKNI